MDQWWQAEKSGAAAVHVLALRDSRAKGGVIELEGSRGRGKRSSRMPRRAGRGLCPDSSPRRTRPEERDDGWGPLVGEWMRVEKEKEKERGRLGRSGPKQEGRQRSGPYGKGNGLAA